MADRPPFRPAPLLVAAALLGLEGLAALVFGGIALSQIRISRAEVGAGVAIWMLGYGILLGYYYVVIRRNQPGSPR